MTATLGETLNVTGRTQDQQYPPTFCPSSPYGS